MNKNNSDIGQAISSQHELRQNKEQSSKYKAHTQNQKAWTLGHSEDRQEKLKPRTGLAKT